MNENKTTGCEDFKKFNQKTYDFIVSSTKTACETIRKAGLDFSHGAKYVKDVKDALELIDKGEAKVEFSNGVAKLIIEQISKKKNRITNTITFSSEELTTALTIYYYMMTK